MYRKLVIPILLELGSVGVLVGGVERKESFTKNAETRKELVEKNARNRCQ